MYTIWSVARFCFFWPKSFEDLRIEVDELLRALKQLFEEWTEIKSAKFAEIVKVAHGKML